MIIWRYILLSFMLVFNSNANEFNYDGALNGDGHYELNIDFKLPLETSLLSIFNTYLYNSDYLKSISHNDEFVSIQVLNQDTNSKIDQITDGKFDFKVITTGQKKLKLDFSIEATIVQDCMLNIQEGNFFELQCQADLSSNENKDTSKFFERFEYIFSCHRDNINYQCSMRSSALMKELSLLFYTYKTNDEAAISGFCRNLVQFYLLYTNLNHLNRHKIPFYKKHISPVRAYLLEQLQDRKFESIHILNSD